MEKHSVKPYLLTAGVLLLAALLLAVLPPVRETGLAGVKDRLPDRVGDYGGTELRYCQNEHCLKVFALPELADASVCPVCGSVLSEVAMAERLLLPAGTTILRKRFTAAGESSFLVTVLLAGHDRNSFHRPELCLPSQGFVITQSQTLEVPIEGRAALPLRFLNLRRAGAAGNADAGQGILAYWFVSPTRETASNWGRLFWMLTDRIVGGHSDRWAYVTVFVDQPGNEASAREALERFVQLLYPYLAPSPASGIAEGPPSRTPP